MWKYLLLGFLSIPALGSNLSIGVGLGYGLFDDLSVPYAVGSYGGLQPRADGSFSRSDVTRRQGLGLQASIASRQEVLDFVSLKNEFSIVQISGVSGVEAENFTSASFDKIAIKSIGQYNVDRWALRELNIGLGAQRMGWRNISTGHLLDTISVIGGFAFRRIQYVQLSVEAEQALLGRFAWDDKTFNLAPKAMKNVKVADRRLEARLSYFRLKGLNFHLDASQQFTNIKFGNLQQNYAQSGLQVNPTLNQVQSRSLTTLRYSFGLERRF